MAPLIDDMTELTDTKEIAIPDFKNDNTTDDNRTNAYDKTTQYLAAGIVTISAFSCGTFLAWTSSALPLLELENSTIRIDRYQGSWIASLLNLGAFFGAIPTGLLAEKFGRKKMLLSLTIPMMLSWLLTALSTSVYCFYVGRFVGGLSVGAVSVAVPPYLAEMAQPAAANALGNFYQIQLASGILFGFLAGLSQNLIILSMICACIPVCYFIAFLFMPESPVYLMTQGKVKEARNSLIYIRGIGCDIDKELNRIKEYINDKISKEGRLKDLVSSGSNIKALIIAFYLMIFQQLSGIIPVTFFMGRILATSGVRISPETSCVLVGIVQLFCACIAARYLRDYRRRPLLISSNVIMSLVFIILGIFVHLNVMTDTEDFSWLPIVCMAVFSGMYTIGMGPVPWYMMREMFPDNIKRRSIAMLAGVHWLSAFIVSKYYQNMVDSIGVGWVLWNFGVACGIAALFIYIFVPETKGKSLEEIHKELDGNPTRRIKHIIEIDSVSVT